MKFVLKDPIRHIPGPGNVPNSLYEAIIYEDTLHVCAILVRL